MYGLLRCSVWNNHDSFEFIHFFVRAQHFLNHPDFDTLTRGKHIPLPEGGVMPDTRLLISTIRSFHPAFAVAHFKFGRRRFNEPHPNFLGSLGDPVPHEEMPMLAKVAPCVLSSPPKTAQESAAPVINQPISPFHRISVRRSSK